MDALVASSSVQDQEFIEQLNNQILGFNKKFGREKFNEISEQDINQIGVFILKESKNVQVNPQTDPIILYTRNQNLPTYIRLATGKQMICTRVTAEGGTKAAYLGYTFDLSGKLTQAAAILKVKNPDRNEIVLKENELAEKFKSEYLVQKSEYFMWDGSIALIQKYAFFSFNDLIIGKDFPSNLAHKSIYLIHALIGANTMHKENYVHGDIKPENILIEWDGNEAIGKLIDLEGACEIGGSISRVSLGFLAPEWLRDYPYLSEIQASKEADSWSFGATFYQIMTKNLPICAHGYKIGRKAQEVLNNPEGFRNQISVELDKLTGLDAPILVPVIKNLLVGDPKSRFTPLQAVQQIEKLIYDP